MSTTQSPLTRGPIATGCRESVSRLWATIECFHSGCPSPQLSSPQPRHGGSMRSLAAALARGCAPSATTTAPASRRELCAPSAARLPPDPTPPSHLLRALCVTSAASVHGCSPSLGRAAVHREHRVDTESTEGGGEVESPA